jgi:hypothetical protein
MFLRTNPTIKAIARIIKSATPTNAMNGFMGYKAHMIITPTAMMSRDTTIPMTASTIPLMSSPYVLYSS